MRFELGKLELFGLDLGGLWQRWWRGINSLMPVPLSDIFLRPAPRVRARMADGQVVFEQWLPYQQPQVLASFGTAEFALLEDKSLYEQLSAGTDKTLLQLDLILPDEQMLRRTLSLPVTARNSLRQALGFQVSRLTPFRREQVLYDAVELGVNETGEVMQVELQVVARNFAEKQIKQLERVSGMTVARLQGPAPGDDRTNLLEQPRVAPNWHRRLNRNSGLALLLALCVGLAMLAPVIKLRVMLLQAKNEIAMLDKKVADTKEGWYGLQQNAANLAFMLEQYTRHGRPAVILDELTRIIPDTVFLTSLTLDGQRIEISGQGTDVVELIEKLNASEVFAHAKFASALTRGRNNLDVFTIGMQWVSGSSLE